MEEQTNKQERSKQFINQGNKSRYRVIQYFFDITDTTGLHLLIVIAISILC